MAAALLFWLALFVPGYVLARLVSPDILKSGLLGTVGLSYVAILGLLSPVSILCYLLRLPVAVMSAGCILAVVLAVAYVTHRRWWGDIGKLVVAGVTIELLILVLDMVMGARVGAFLGGGDERLHIARIRFLLDHGISNDDPFVAVRYFFPIYHTNLLHTLYAACSQITRIDYLGVWYMSLVWAKLLIVSAYYYMGWCVFQRRWVAWVVALFALGWLAPVTYMVYPNKLAPHWLIPMMLGFGVQACRTSCSWSSPLKLAVGSLLLGQVHSLYAVFAGIALGPVLTGAFLIRLLRRRPTRWASAACIGALFLAAPFALIAKSGQDSAPTQGTTPIKHTQHFQHWDNGWAMLRPGFLQGNRGIIIGALAVAGTVCSLVSSRRKEATVLIAAAASVAAIAFIPPLCAAAIKAFGKEWIVARMGAVLLIGLVGLTFGGVSFLLERPLRRWWLRSLISVGVVFLGGQFGSFKAPHDWRSYYDRLRQPAEVRHNTLDRLRKLRQFCQEHIPPGDTILAHPQTEMSLVMLYDCHAVRATRGGGVKDSGQRKKDMYDLISGDTGWEKRLTVIHKYGIKLFIADKRYVSSYDVLWAKGHLKREPLLFLDTYLLLHLDPT